jgi:hypothetical protein
VSKIYGFKETNTEETPQMLRMHEIQDCTEDA